MLRPSEVVKSPAAPSAVLLYGIVFLFAGAYYIGASWHRTYTIVLYMGVLAWSAAVISRRLGQYRVSANRIDVLFGIFLASVLLSAALNWWDGTIEQLKLMPVLFLAPYVLGRFILEKDAHVLRDLLIVMSLVLMLLLLPEFVRDLRDGRPYVDSPAPFLFARNHGVMLSGLLLSAGLLSLISSLLTPEGGGRTSFFMSSKGRYWGYALTICIIATVGWISSRGPAIGGFFGIGILLLLSPKSMNKRKVEILVVLTLAVAAAAVWVLHSKYISQYYAAVAQGPVTLDAAPATPPIQWPGSAVSKSSILGDIACARIKDSITDRWIHYQQAAALFLSKPFFGAGANHYGFYACSGPGTFPHSTLLQVFAELGAIVGLIYCTLIGVTLHAFVRARQAIGTIGGTSVWLWFLAFSATHVLIAQLNGNYFYSAPLYFVMGVAASVFDRGAAGMRSH